MKIVDLHGGSENQAKTVTILYLLFHPSAIKMVVKPRPFQTRIDREATTISRSFHPMVPETRAEPLQFTLSKISFRMGRNMENGISF